MPHKLPSVPKSSLRGKSILVFDDKRFINSSCSLSGLLGLSVSGRGPSWGQLEKVPVGPGNSPGGNKMDCGCHEASLDLKIKVIWSPASMCLVSTKQVSSLLPVKQSGS